MMNGYQALVGFVLSILSLHLSAQIDRTSSWSDEKIDRFFGDAAIDRGAAAQYESLQRLRDRVRSVGSDAPDASIARLAEGLRKLSRKNIFQVHDRIEVYDLVQSTILSIPGHDWR